ncbi:MAG: 2TM domain-containing protein [Cyanobacteria bacterium J06621_8]
MSDITPSYPDSYTQEDIQQILQLAIAKHHTEEELTRQQLWEIAADLDISNAAIQTAERDWLEQKALDRQRSSFDLYRRQEFKQKLTKYAIANTFLMSFNFISAGSLSWSLYILLIWGLGVTLSGWQAYLSRGEEYERAFQRWSFQNEFKQTVANVWTRLRQTWQG